MNQLKDFSDGLAAVSARREEERAAFNKALGEPHHFTQSEDHPDHGVGYWRAINGGVVAYRKYSNGYDPFSRHEYPNDLIDILNKVK